MKRLMLALFVIAFSCAAFAQSAHVIGPPAYPGVSPNGSNGLTITGAVSARQFTESAPDGKWWESHEAPANGFPGVTSDFVSLSGRSWMYDVSSGSSTLTEGTNGFSWVLTGASAGTNLCTTAFAAGTWIYDDKLSDASAQPIDPPSDIVRRFGQTITINALPTASGILFGLCDYNTNGDDGSLCGKTTTDGDAGMYAYVMASNGTLVAKTTTGTAATTLTLSPAKTLKAGTTFTYEWRYTSTYADLYVDGVRLGRSTTNLPSTTMAPFLKVCSESATSVSASVSSSFYKESNSPKPIFNAVSAEASLFSQLGGIGVNDPAGTLRYCSDCKVATPASCNANAMSNCVCAGSGTGAFAKKVGTTWYCN